MHVAMGSIPEGPLPAQVDALVQATGVVVCRCTCCWGARGCGHCRTSPRARLLAGGRLSRRRDGPAAPRAARADRWVQSVRLLQGAHDAAEVSRAQTTHSPAPAASQIRARPRVARLGTLICGFPSAGRTSFS